MFAGGLEWVVLGLVALLLLPVGVGFLIGYFVGRGVGRKEAAYVASAGGLTRPSRTIT